MVSRRFIAATLSIAISTFVATLISYIIGIYPDLSLTITISLGFVVLLLATLFLLQPWFSNGVWKLRMKWRLWAPTIGIIEQNGCPAPFTSFTPTDWRRHLDALSLKTKTISVMEINNKYAAIINPYGETYPEEDIVNLKSLDRIEKYISNGGIFVCAGGLAFFYGYDFKSKRNLPLGEPLQVYVQRNRPRQPLVLTAEEAYPSYSLTNTVLKQRFNILTSFGDTTRNPVFQTASDRRFVGDLVNVGGIPETLQFRAVREPTRKCIPFLRTKLQLAEERWMELYVIAAVPHGKGCLVLCGMNLGEQPKSKLWDPQIHRANFLKICEAVKRLLESRNKGLIPLSAEDW